MHKIEYYDLEQFLLNHGGAKYRLTNCYVILPTHNQTLGLLDFKLAKQSYERNK